MTSLPVTDPLPRDAGADLGGDLLVAKAITKAYRRGTFRRHSHELLKGASLALGRGEIVGLVGENGSGKSTLMKILVGTLDRDSGTVSRTQSFGYCPQDPVLYERLTSDEHFELFGEAYGLGGTVVAESRDELYGDLDFERYRGARVEELSGGTRAKLNLALALLPDPEMKSMRPHGERQTSRLF